jgi:hypothetical protein
MGMANKKAEQKKITAQEMQLIERLREHPELRERFQAVLDITAAGEGRLKTADEVEGLLIEEMRRLGHRSMTDWAVRAEQRLGEELKQKDPSVYAGKKNAAMVVHFWISEGGRTNLAQLQGELRARVAKGNRCESARAFAAVGTCVDGFWL